MMVNPGVDDSYAEALNHQKIILETQKATTYSNPNEY